MRKLLVLFLVLLVAPAAAFARTTPPPPPTNGTLSIREGRGMVLLSARGSITGRVNGKITITDPNPYDANRPVVYGATKTQYRNDKTALYLGRNLRFRLLGSLFQVRIEGRSIFMSAIGRGKGTLDGEGDPSANIFYDGVWSLNDEAYHSLPDDPTAFELAGVPQPG